MRESFERSALIGASRGDAWATLHDVDRLASYSSHIGPVTIVQRDRRWMTSLQDRVGLLRLSAPMEVEVIAETAMAEISIRASGKDRGPGTRLLVEASIRIDQTSEGTQMNLHGRYDLRGKVASLGTAVAKRQAETMIDEFWSNLTADLKS